MGFSCNCSFVVLTLVVTLFSILRCYLFLLGCSLGDTRKSFQPGQFKKSFIQGRPRTLRKIVMVRRRLSPVRISSLGEMMECKGNTFKTGILKVDN
jgi:hypothetical protein